MPQSADKVCVTDQAIGRIVPLQTRPNPAATDPMNWPHISDDDLERYYLGLVTGESELAILEEHLLVCAECVDRMKETQDYVDAIRAGMTLGGFDLE